MNFQEYPELELLLIGFLGSSHAATYITPPLQGRYPAKVANAQWAGAATPRPFLLLPPRSRSSSESSLTSPYVHSPLLAHSLKRIDYSGDLPLGIYGRVYQDVDFEVVRRRGRTLAYELGGQRTVECGGRLRELFVLGERGVVEVLGTTIALASPLDVVLKRGLGHAGCIYRGVPNCVQSTLDLDQFARAAKEGTVVRSSVD